MEENQQKLSLWARPSIKYGVIGGVISSFIFALLYLIDYKLFNSPLWTNVPLMVIAVCSILAGIEKRRMCGGYVFFGNVLASILGAFMIALVINTLFLLLLFFLIDPEIISKLTELRREGLAMEVEKGTYPKQYLDSFDESIAKTGEKRLMLYQSFGGFLLFSALGLIISLIAAAFIKKTPKS